MRLRAIGRALTVLSFIPTGGLVLAACGGTVTSTITSQEVATHCTSSLTIDTTRLSLVATIIQGHHFFAAFAGSNKVINCTGSFSSKGYVLGGTTSNGAATNCLAGALMAICLRNGDQKVWSWVLAVRSDIVRIRAIDSKGLLLTTNVARGVGGVLSPAGASGIEVTGFDAHGRVVDSLSLLPG